MASSRVFVSHSHQDNIYSREFVGALRRHGYQVWYDEHNLSWGALRPTIEKEMPLCQHFIAIFSPNAVTSDWVNAEIDAALSLLKEGVLHTITFVVARECDVPLLLRRWKRIEGSGGGAIGAEAAAGRAAAILASAAITAKPSGVLVPVPISPAPPLVAPVLPTEVFPSRLVKLGFIAQERNSVKYILPPVCSVPAGEFLMGSDKLREKDPQADAQPQHRVTLAAYSIARFPVTVAEYACFVKMAKHRQPVGWANKIQNLDHPIADVSWNDAVAYAEWLTKATGHLWRLPSEAEWEKAARGTDGRIYPWGDMFDPSRANTGESRKRGTTAVGSFSKWASPYGVEEMAGNIWEWTSSLFKPYPYTKADGRDTKNSAENRVLRGGSWLNDQRFARASYRIGSGPDRTYNYYYKADYGFRLLLVARGSAIR
jgi:formylglycine-generating enzyme required for sulfatase activity